MIKDLKSLLPLFLTLIKSAFFPLTDKKLTRTWIKLETAETKDSYRPYQLIRSTQYKMRSLLYRQFADTIVLTEETNEVLTISLDYGEVL